MKKYGTKVNHYWAKTTDAVYGGPGQQLLSELLISSIFVSITYICGKTKGLEIFFAGFIIPTIIVVLGTLTTIYYMLTEYLERNKGADQDDE